MKETEQTLLEKIKDQVAEEKVHVLWEDLTPIGRSRCWPIVCERYAEAKAKAEVIDFYIYMTYNQDESMRPLVEELYNKFKGQNIKTEYFTHSQVQASCEATLKKASENAMVHYKGNLMCDPSDSSVLYHPDGSEFSINKQSITDPSNIVIV